MVTIHIVNIKNGRYNQWMSSEQININTLENQKIIDAEPTDGLWNDGRNDTNQLGMTYTELEKAMENKDDPNYQKYLEIRKKNLHKMKPIPVCKFDDL